MLDKGSSLLQTVQLHEVADVFFAAIHHQVDVAFKAFLAVQSRHYLGEVKVFTGLFDLLFGQLSLPLESFSQVFSLNKYLLEAFHLVYLLQLRFKRIKAFKL
jgi:hypothetical protein